MIKAIETTYKGYKFRSRLEARWAVFFDAIGIKWQYEPEGFKKSVEYDEDEQPRTVRYLPDFYLPETGTWVEVKGVWTEKDATDTAFMLDYGSPLWHFDDSADEWDWSKRNANAIRRDVRGLLLLGEIPEIRHGHVFHPIVVHYKGLKISYMDFFGQWGGPSRVNIDLARFASQISGPIVQDKSLDGFAVGREAIEFFSTKPVVAELKYSNKKIAEAYNAARSARFEFGHSGAVA